MRVCVINKITPRYIRRGPLNFYMSDTGWRTSVPGSVWAPVFDYACRSVGFGIARSFNTCFNIRVFNLVFSKRVVKRKYVIDKAKLVKHTLCPMMINGAVPLILKVCTYKSYIRRIIITYAHPRGLLTKQDKSVTTIS